MKVSTLLADVRDMLETAGVPCAAVDAELLLAHVLGAARARLCLEAEQELARETVAAVLELSLIHI